MTAFKHRVPTRHGVDATPPKPASKSPEITAVVGSVMAAATLLLAPAAHAFTQQCPNDAYGAPDGCDASAGGNVVDPNFLNDIRQSGQGPYVGTIPWNAPGVTYPVGIPSAVFTGTISGNTLTVTSMSPNSQTYISKGMTLDEGWGGVLAGTHITGGMGMTWTLDKSQTISTPVTMYAQALKDPSTIGSDPACKGACKFYATGSPTGGPEVIVSGTVSPYISGYDFGPSSAVTGKCVALFIGANVTGLTLKNNKFVSDANCNNIGGEANQGGFGWQIRENGGAYWKTYQNNLFDGCGTVDAYCPVGFNNVSGASTSYPAMVVSNSGYGTEINEYNAWLNVNGRFINEGHTAPSGTSLIDKWNFVCGMVFGTNTVHGEFRENANQSGGVGALYDVEYNTVCEQATAQNNQDGGNATTSLWYISDGTSTLTFTEVDIIGNILISNQSPNYPASSSTCVAPGQHNGPCFVTSSALVEFSGDTYTNTTITNNLEDPTGSYSGFVTVGSVKFINSPVFSGNTSLIDGSAQNQFDVIAGAAPGSHK